MKILIMSSINGIKIPIINKLSLLYPNYVSFTSLVISPIIKDFPKASWCDNKKMYCKWETIYNLLIREYGFRILRNNFKISNDLIINRLINNILPTIYLKQLIFINNQLDRYIDEKNRGLFSASTSTQTGSNVTSQTSNTAEADSGKVGNTLKFDPTLDSIGSKNINQVNQQLNNKNDIANKNNMYDSLQKMKELHNTEIGLNVLEYFEILEDLFKTYYITTSEPTTKEIREYITVALLKDPNSIVMNKNFSIKTIGLYNEYNKEYLTGKIITDWSITNATDIANNTNTMNWNGTNITINKTGITTNKTDITTNKTAISKIQIDTKQVEINKKLIDSIATQLAAHNQMINKNTDRIFANETNITTNKTNIKNYNIFRDDKYIGWKLAIAGFDFIFGKTEKTGYPSSMIYPDVTYPDVYLGVDAKNIGNTDTLKTTSKIIVPAINSLATSISKLKSKNYQDAVVSVNQKSTSYFGWFSIQHKLSYSDFSEFKIVMLFGHSLQNFTNTTNFTLKGYYKDLIAGKLYNIELPYVNINGTIKLGGEEVNRLKSILCFDIKNNRIEFKQWYYNTKINNNYKVLTDYFNIKLRYTVY